jgi:heptosyltransferase-1
VHRIATRSWRRQGWLAAVRESLRTVRSLREERYDVVLDLQGNGKSGLFTLLSGASRRCGFDQDGVREWPNLLATTCRVKLTADDHHISERSLAIARAAFPSGNVRVTAGPLPVLPAAAQRIDAQLVEHGLAGRRFAVLHYGTTWTTKLWPIENWLELTRNLAVGGDPAPLLTWGSAAEKDAVERIAVNVGNGTLVWPRGTLPELAALLARATVVVGGDTGPVHIAAAVGTPTVSIYRVTDQSRNGPRGDRHIRLQAPLDCSPCLRKQCERDGACGLSIPVAEVLSAIRIVLAGDGATGLGTPESVGVGTP